MKIKTIQEYLELEISSVSTVDVECYKTVQSILLSIAQCSDLKHNHLNYGDFKIIKDLIKVLETYFRKFMIT